MNYDLRAREQRKLLKKTGNPTWSFLWRVLVCCFVIDAAVWGYFIFIEKVPVFVGLQRIYDRIHKNRAIKNDEDVVEKRIIKIEPVEKQNQYYEAEKNKPVQQTFYSWKTKDGRKGFSNVGFPSDEAYTEGKIELSK